MFFPLQDIVGKGNLVIAVVCYCIVLGQFILTCFSDVKAVPGLSGRGSNKGENTPLLDAEHRKSIPSVIDESSETTLVNTWRAKKNI